MSIDLAVFVLGLVVSLVTGTGLLSFYLTFAASQAEPQEAAEGARRSAVRRPAGGAL